MASDNYHNEVMFWGNQNPWGQTRMPESPVILFTDLITDSQGNVINMPTLLGRPCFGRVETFLRHGRPNQTAMVRGKPKTSPTRCGRCQVRDACRGLVNQRILASPEITAAVREWHTTLQPNDRHIFTGPLGLKWSAVKLAIVKAGRKTNSNDAVAESHRAEKRREDLERRARQRRKMRQANIAKKLPDIDAINEAPAERDERVRLLERHCQSSRATHQQSRWLSDTCNMIGDAWLARTILKASHKRHGPSSVARWLILEGRSDKEFAALRVRSAADLKRVDEIEALTGASAIWPEFDPCMRATVRELAGT